MRLWYSSKNRSHLQDIERFPWSFHVCRHTGNSFAWMYACSSVRYINSIRCISDKNTDTIDEAMVPGLVQSSKAELYHWPCVTTTKPNSDGAQPYPRITCADCRRAHPAGVGPQRRPCRSRTQTVSLNVIIRRLHQRCSGIQLTVEQQCLRTLLPFTRRPVSHQHSRKHGLVALPTVR